MTSLEHNSLRTPFESSCNFSIQCYNSLRTPFKSSCNFSIKCCTRKDGKLLKSKVFSHSPDDPMLILPITVLVFLVAQCVNLNMDSASHVDLIPLLILDDIRLQNKCRWLSTNSVLSYLKSSALISYRREYKVHICTVDCG
jgi:hypothetical protein